MKRPAADSLDCTLEQAARHLRTHEVTPLELTRLYLDRIEALNPSLHAFVAIMAAVYGALTFFAGPVRDVGPLISLIERGEPSGHLK